MKDGIQHIRQRSVANDISKSKSTMTFYLGKSFANKNFSADASDCSSQSKRSDPNETKEERKKRKDQEKYINRLDPNESSYAAYM